MADDSIEIHAKFMRFASPVDGMLFGIGLVSKKSFLMSLHDFCFTMIRRHWWITVFYFPLFIYSRVAWGSLPPIILATLSYLVWLYARGRPTSGDNQLKHADNENLTSRSKNDMQPAIWLGCVMPLL